MNPSNRRKNVQKTQKAKRSRGTVSFRFAMAELVEAQRKYKAKVRVHLAMRPSGPLQKAMTLHPCPFCGGVNLREHRPVFGKKLRERYPNAAASSGVFDACNPLAEHYAVICNECHAVGPLADHAAMARLLWDLRSKAILPKR